MRPEPLFPLFADVASLKGLGPKLRPLVAKLAGERVRDLLFLSPSGLVDRQVRRLEEVEEGEIATVRVCVDAHLRPSRAGHPYRIRVADETGFAFLSWVQGVRRHS